MEMNTLMEPIRITVDRDVKHGDICFTLAFKYASEEVLRNMTTAEGFRVNGKIPPILIFADESVFHAKTQQANLTAIGREMSSKSAAAKCSG